MAEKKGASSGHWAFAHWSDHKIHALTDTCGCTVAFLFNLGNCADISVAPALLDKVPCRPVFWPARAMTRTACATVLEKKNRSGHPLKTIPCNANAYIGRNLIERTFCRLKDWRRIAARYDTAIAIAAVILC